MKLIIIIWKDFFSFQKTLLFLVLFIFAKLPKWPRWRFERLIKRNEVIQKIIYDQIISRGKIVFLKWRIKLMGRKKLFALGWLLSCKKGTGEVFILLSSLFSFLLHSSFFLGSVCFSCQFGFLSKTWGCTSSFFIHASPQLWRMCYRGVCVISSEIIVLFAKCSSCFSFLHSKP